MNKQDFTDEELKRIQHDVNKGRSTYDQWAHLKHKPDVKEDYIEEVNIREDILKKLK